MLQPFLKKEGMTKMATKLIEVLIILIEIFKGGINMVDLYIALVIAGRRTCNPENKEVTQVPTRYRDIVTEELAAIGLDADGNPVM